MKYDFSNEQFAKKFARAQSLFDSTLYQRNNVKRVCRLFQISWNELNIIYKISNMTIFQQLRDWQIIDIKVLFDFVSNDDIRKCIFADVVDFEKTWMLIKTIMSICIERLNRNLSQMFMITIAYQNRKHYLIINIDNDIFIVNDLMISRHKVDRF